MARQRKVRVSQVLETNDVGAQPDENKTDENKGLVGEVKVLRSALRILYDSARRTHEWSTRWPRVESLVRQVLGIPPENAEL